MAQKPKQIQWRPFLRVILHVFLMATFLFVMALLLAWFIQYRYMNNDSNATWQFFLANPGIYWYSVAIISMILVILSAIVRPFLAAGITSSVIVGIMFANQYKFAVQNVPLLPEDLQLTGNAGDLMRFVDGGHLARTIIAIILILALSIFLTVLTYKHWVRKDLPWWRRHAIIQRVVILLIASTILTTLMNNLIEQSNKVHRGESAEWMGITEFIDFEQNSNYENLGFVAGFIYNFKSATINPPTNYSESTIQNLAAQYNKKQEEENKKRIDLEKQVDKLIIVLDESFYDPAIARKYYPYDGDDVTPNLHQIFAKHPHGRMYSSVYGGLTANVEFEVDTGLSNYWANTMPFSTLVPYVDQLPAVGNTAKNRGFYTAKVHTYNGTLYKRSLALPKEGFSDFFTDQNISYTKIDPGENYINDYSAYHEVFDRIKNNNDKQLFGVITMQNHAPYGDRNYTNLDFMPLDDNGVRTQAPEEVPTAQYYQSLHASDQAIGDFINALNSLDQRTAVLLYGDHAGGIMSRILDDSDQKVSQLAYQTPYFIYTNFELKNKQNLELKTTSPNCLVNTMYNVLNVKKSALGYLLDDVCKEEPILTHTYLGDKKPSEAKPVKAYELINYDILNGQQYWMKYANQ